MKVAIFLKVMETLSHFGGAHSNLRAIEEDLVKRGVKLSDELTPEQEATIKGALTSAMKEKQ